MIRLRKEEKIAYICILPSFILISAVIFFPVVKTFINAFYSLDLYGNIQHFSGFDNFKRLFREDVFLRITINTLYWTVGMVFITVAVSLVLALALNHEFIGRKFSRIILILPWAASVMISALLWKWLFNSDYGMLNRLLRELHIISENINWLATPKTSFPAMIFVGVVISIPFTTITFLAGLQSIPNELYEAARVDGANKLKVIYKITLPLLKNVFFIVTTLNVIYIFNSFPIIWVITRGNPASQTDIVITYLYKKAFLYQDFGIASALSILIFFLLLTFSILYAKLIYKRGE
ncbi:MAG: sugar ABC transporter permease [Spirochaetes bacterium]|nr:sugar ABC transporter permease [Spirochaetota bacterium]